MDYHFTTTSNYYDQCEFLDFGATCDDSSDDDASAYFPTFHLCPQSTSFETKYDECAATNDAMIKKQKDFIAWTKKLERETSTHKMYVCGRNSVVYTKKWLEDFGKKTSTMRFEDINTVIFQKCLIGGDVVIIEVASILDVTDNIDVFKGIKGNNIVVCCNDIKNCQRNKGMEFNAVFKRITLKG
ncbi:hypothetical protein EIN_184370 [Entamoeba invadens IP1]|uniref:hypothetical protein n=1 Tax=Entamoeba invadens IP1 TaxID=370355 RepID=UPI0002C3DBB8|nr:hypothetical protein EIN_184370 [Entamoeba invadens IP1]ELP94090.1 hypothetical protein EIN_184370 [Entamoeba invadens IP1]|eukprot:XP_004260861.1 hypothetical protein EIN_184370 [Entamoeba invadens IP1]